MLGIVKLQVYIRRGSWSCAESQRIIDEITPQFPQIAIELLDIGAPNRPNNVCAVPTYILNDRIISSGYPYLDKLRRELENALNHHQS